MQTTITSNLKPGATKAHYTPYQAAQIFRTWLMKHAGIQSGDPEASYIEVWNRAKVQEMGWGQGTARAQVAAEGCGFDIAEWHLWFDELQPFPGVFMEPYSSWLMSFYHDTLS